VVLYAVELLATPPPGQAEGPLIYGCSSIYPQSVYIWRTLQF